MTIGTRLDALLAAEGRADGLLAAIETGQLIRPGQTGTEVDKDIYILAKRSFGLKQHWHQRIVRAGRDTVRVFAENPPVRVMCQSHRSYQLTLPLFGQSRDRFRNNWSTVSAEPNCSLTCVVV